MDVSTSTPPATLPSPPDTCYPHLDTMTSVGVVLHSLIFVLSIAGNGLVIATIAFVPRMRSVTNIFLCSLALSDLLLSIVNEPASVIGLVYRCFFFGEVMCRVLVFSQPMVVTVSIYMLVLISLERYNAICRPLRAMTFQTKGRAVKLTLVVWFWSAVVNTPLFAVTELVEISEGQYNCRWQFANKAHRRIYHIWMMMLLFVFPFAIMAVFYTRITLVLWSDIWQSLPCWRWCAKPEVPRNDSFASNGLISPTTEINNLPGAKTSKFLLATLSPRRSRQNSTQSLNSTVIAVTQLRSTNASAAQASKRRTIKVLFALVACFFTCWVPFHTFWLLDAFEGISWSLPSSYTLYFMFLLLSYASACVNPILLAFIGRSFQKAIVQLLTCRVHDSPHRAPRGNTVTLKNGTSTPVVTPTKSEGLKVHRLSALVASTEQLPPKQTPTETNTTNSLYSRLRRGELVAL